MTVPCTLPECSSPSHWAVFISHVGSVRCADAMSCVCDHHRTMVEKLFNDNLHRRFCFGCREDVMLTSIDPL